MRHQFTVISLSKPLNRGVTLGSQAIAVQMFSNLYTPYSLLFSALREINLYFTCLADHGHGIPTKWLCVYRKPARARV